MSEVELEKCSNCGRFIGKLETPAVWDEVVVCFECHQLLETQRAAKIAANPHCKEAYQDQIERNNSPEDRRERVIQEEQQRKRIRENHWVICPNPKCGFQGESATRARGSRLLMILLFCIGIVPGMLYLVFWGGKEYYCPSCGIKR